MLATVAVIGGGGTGIAAAYDLALQGFNVFLLEKGEFTSGTTGRHHGQLHSGARYAVKDPAIGRECMRESAILRSIAPHCIEGNGGLFVSLTAEDDEYSETFIDSCGKAGIPVQRLTGDEARSAEPALSKSVRSAVSVPDGTIDAFRLPSSFLAGAVESGAKPANFCEATAVEVTGDSVRSVSFFDLIEKKEYSLETDIVINAAGPWSGMVAEKAGCSLEITPAPGTMVAVEGRKVNRVISRLSPPGNGDIIVPQRKQLIIGTTEWVTDDPEALQPRDEDIPFLIEEAEKMIPNFGSLPRVSAWAAARPLAGKAHGDADTESRALTRGFSVIDHGNKDHGHKAKGFFSIVGGKATILRKMGEVCTDAVLDFIGSKRKCSTTDILLPSWRELYKKGALPRPGSYTSVRVC